MSREILYPDGSFAQPGVRVGGMAVRRIALFAACQALQVWLKQADAGKPASARWQLTRNGHRLAVLNVIEPMTGMKFSSPSGRVSDDAARRALAAGIALMEEIDASVVVLDTEGES